MLKRAAIPVTDGIIVKVIDIALRRLIPKCRKNRLNVLPNITKR